LAKGSAQQWNTSTGERVGRALNHGDGVCSATYSPDGRWIVTASEDRYAIIWNADTGQPVGRPLEHDDQVQWAEFSSDGSWVVTASWDGSARVWNANTGDPLTPPLRHAGRLARAHFLDNDRRIITSNAAGDHWIWTLTVDNRPSRDLFALGLLLSGKTIVGAQGPVVSSSPALQKIWKDLRARYAEMFTVTPEQVAAWHRSELEQCEVEENWSAAAFHLRALARLQPADSSWLDRLSVVEQHRKELNDRVDKN
jgi:WD40 repeat protein